MNSENDIKRIINKMVHADRLLFITGAGISVESGLPTYRGIGGLYNNCDAEKGVSIEEALSGAMFQNNPSVTWNHIYSIEMQCRSATYNRAHKIIADMQTHFSHVCVLTQNIDGFHLMAGSKHVIDIHGDMRKLKCTKCDFTCVVENYAGITVPPYCEKCHAIIRPDVVLFGEALPLKKIEQLNEELTQGFDIIFSIGTTSVFPYIAQPVIYASQTSTMTVEINPGMTSVSDYVDIKISMNAGEALTTIWNAYRDNCICARGGMYE